MYAVIFKATAAHLDDEYFRVVKRMKDLAFSKYGCHDFVSMTEGDQRIAISYWKTKQQIRDWKNDPEHRSAQEKGRNRWYKSFSVEICEIVRTRGGSD